MNRKITTRKAYKMKYKFWVVYDWQSSYITDKEPPMHTVSDGFASWYKAKTTLRTYFEDQRQSFKDAVNNCRKLKKEDI